MGGGVRNRYNPIHGNAGCGCEDEDSVSRFLCITASTLKSKANCACRKDSGIQADSTTAPTLNDGRFSACFIPIGIRRLCRRIDLVFCCCVGRNGRVEAVIDLAYRDIPNHVLLLKGVLFGQRSELSRDILEAFQNSGSLHILAVSGLHVGLIAAVCFLGFPLLRIPPKITCLLTIVAAIFYVCLVGFCASVLRASLRVVLFLIAQTIDRNADLINPAQLWDVGFQLSFAAVASIVYLLPRWNSFTVPILTDGTVGQNSAPCLRYAWGQVVKWGVVAFGVTLSAQFGTFLILARHFYRIYPLRLIASPFAVGLVVLIITLALISVFVGIIWLPLTTPFAYANHLILLVFLGIIEFFGQPWGVQKIESSGLGWIVLYIGGCLAVVYCAWPETAFLAQCEDRACQGTIAEKSAILTDVEYMLRWTCIPATCCTLPSSRITTYEVPRRFCSRCGPRATIFRSISMK